MNFGLQKCEIWRTIASFDRHYDCSNRGRVRSFDRVVAGKNGSKRIVKGRVLKPWINNNSYLMVTLCKDGIRRKVGVHCLVLETFVGQCPDGHEACHNNGNSFDNRLENLRWDTPKNNQADRVIHGTDCIGSKNPSSKLTEWQVLEIRRGYIEGASQEDLANQFGVDRVNVGHIVRGKIWTHVAGPITHRGKGRPRKLVADQVIKIRKTYEEGGVTLSDLAGQFMVSIATISNIINHKTWSDL